MSYLIIFINNYYTCPPSAMNACPMIKEAKGDAKKVTKLPIPSIVPNLFKDTSFFKNDFTCEEFFSIFFSQIWIIPLVISNNSGF